MDSYRTLEVFPEVPEILERLKRKGIKTAILSNGSYDMLSAAVSSARIELLLEPCYPSKRLVSTSLIRRSTNLPLTVWA
jgi:ribonucleotide monophosphatase NagD (HAD superfamily)